MSATAEKSAEKIVLNDRFLIVDHLGSDALGALYLCRDSKRASRDVTLRVLEHEFSENPYLRSRIKSELERRAGVGHPNLLDVGDYFEQEDICAYRVEHTSDQTLRELLSNGVRFRDEEFVEIIRGIAQGLEALHRSGLIFHGVSPEQVVLSKTGRPRLGEFGPGLFPEFLFSAQDKGSRFYLAPETILAGVKDERSDIYSLGVLALELSGHLFPFTKVAERDLERSISGQNFPPLRTLRPALGEKFSEAVERAVEKKPQQRFQSIAEFLSAIDSTASVAGVRSDIQPEQPAPYKKGATAARKATVVTKRPITEEKETPKDSPLLLVVFFLVILALPVVSSYLLEGSEEPAPEIVSSDVESTAVPGVNKRRIVESSQSPMTDEKSDGKIADAREEPAQIQAEEEKVEREVASAVQSIFGVAASPKETKIVSATGTKPELEESLVVVEEQAQEQEQGQEQVDSQQVLSSLPTEEGFVLHTVTYPGESLSVVTDWYTGKLFLWKKVAAANPRINPAALEIGQQIRIPIELVTNNKPFERSHIAAVKRKVAARKKN